MPNRRKISMKDGALVI